MVRLKNQAYKPSKKQQGKDDKKSTGNKRKESKTDTQKTVKRSKIDVQEVADQYKYPDYFGTVAHIAIRVRLTSGSTIHEKLTPSQRDLFRKTCFGAYLNRDLPHCSQQLVHCVLQREVKPEFVPEGSSHQSMSFDVRGKVITFGLREFGILTGLPFSRNGQSLKRQLAKRKKELKNEAKGRFFKKYFLPVLIDESNGVFKNPKQAEKVGEGKGKKKIPSLRHRHIEQEFTLTDWSKENDEDAITMAMLFFIHGNIWTYVDGAFVMAMFRGGFKDSFFLARMQGMPDNFIRPWTEIEMVLIPIIHEKHWFLGAFMIRRLHIYLYDSLPNHISNASLSQLMSTIAGNIKRLMIQSGLFRQLHFSNDITWNRVDGVPQQVFLTNDCGPMVMANGRTLAERNEKDHQHFKCNYDGTLGAHLRLRFAVEIYQQQLIGFERLEDNLVFDNL